MPRKQGGYMTIKKYRLCLLMVLLVVVLVGAIVMVQNAEEDSTYTDGIMVHRECIYEGEEYL